MKMGMEADMSIAYGYKTKQPSSLLSSIFMSTANAAAKTLVSVSKTQQTEKWKAMDHMRFMVMLITWLTLWVLRVLMDYLPSSSIPYSPQYLLGFVGSLALPGPSSSSSSSSSFPSLDLAVHEGLDGPSVQALGRALSQILALLNEIPATSRKYQFAMAMADRIMEENARFGHMELLQINRMTLASAFAHTSNLLCETLKRTVTEYDHHDNNNGTWSTSLIRMLPMGSYLSSYMKGLGVCVNAVRSIVAKVGTCHELQKKRQLGGIGRETDQGEVEEVMAEKLAQELLWITTRVKDYGTVDDALVQWSFASDLASLSLATINVRVQGFIVKISAILFRDLIGEDLKISRQVKFRLLLFWLPLFCHASNGLTYPVLTRFEKMQVESAIDEVLSSLPASDQEVILTNWLQDFAIAASDWLNLQFSYDRWCQTSRKVVS